MDKGRGYGNGAVGVVQTILCSSNDVPTVFTVKLSTGVLVLVHPMTDKRQCFLPCTYGYATTIRKAQGATYHHGCLWFDHCYPPERGYGYVGASRFKSKSGIYLFGKIRCTDWLPVRSIADPTEFTDRGEESMSDYDSADDDAEADSIDQRPQRRLPREDAGTDSDESSSASSYLSDDDFTDYHEKLASMEMKPVKMSGTPIADCL